ncbi:MAG: hypothetical protein HFG96_10470 [Lachnospiraceae bacterium]|jgi:poly(3-hydroxybutyrate) depolymerase|nr:hypothetical protein [Lachnospiraceae bacterium]
MKRRTGYLKKTAVVTMAALMAASAALTGVCAAEAQEERVYDYENKYLWYVPTESFTWDNYGCLADHHSKMGGTAVDGTEFDFDAFVNSPLGESLVTNTKNFILYSDEYGEDEYAYWESLGIRKEMHDFSDKAGKWATFTPMDVYAEENEGKTWPVLFVFHGGNNPIYVTESYGYAQLAAEEGFICVMPWAANGGSKDEEEGTTLDAEMDRIMEELRAEYPIDESRIYACGYSLGGRSTVRETVKHPQLFAAITVGGHNLGGIRQGETYVFPEEEWNALKETPVLQLEGDNEMRVKLPYGLGVTGEDATNALNRWFKINGIDREVTLEGCQELVDTTEDPVQKKIGLEADRLYTQYYEGTEFYTADFFNEDGVNMIKIINVEGMIHWMTQAMAQNAWDFMSQYARDTETGELIVLNQDYTPQLEPQEIEYKTQGSFIQEYTLEAAKGEPVTVTVKASADVKEYKLTLKDGTPLAVESEVQAREDGFNDWTLTTSVDRAGKAMLQLIPITEEGEQEALVLPVLVQ